MPEVLVGRTYAHYKWGEYEVLHVATDEATGEEIVVYKSLDTGKAWARKKTVWLETVEVSGQSIARFHLLKFEKLVRDRIPEIIRAEGKHPEIRQVSWDELFAFLTKKLLEETNELLAAPKDIWEYADVFAVLREMADQKGIAWSSIEQKHLQKLTDRGGFWEGWIWSVDKK